MKTLTSCFLTGLAITGTSLAGPPVIAVKEYKEVVAAVEPLFRANELSLDIFYSYNDASHQEGRSERKVKDRHFVIDEVDPIDRTITDRHWPRHFRDGSGGGVGLNYFFTCYLGVSVEGNWWNGSEGGEEVHVTRGIIIDDRGKTIDRGKTSKRGSFHTRAAHQVTGNIILRYPFEGGCVAWAPYIFGGGGGIWNSSGTGFGDVGIGAEVRLTRHLGLFSDWRWNFMGGNHNDVNTTRAGVRFVF